MGLIFINATNSGVARVPCALEQEIFLRPPKQKLRSLKRKIVQKVRKKQKQNIYKQKRQ